MIIRPCTAQDIAPAFEIISHIQAEFVAKGINQWQDGYPAPEDLQKDLSLGFAYFLEEDGQAAGYFALCLREEPYYSVIYNGAWLCPGPYAVIHRLAIQPAKRRQGLATRVLEYALQEARRRGARSLRADTHEHNLPARNLFLKAGFTPCGTIFVRKHGKRDAFEKPL